MNGADARTLTFWEYTAMRWNWNDRHKRKDENGGDAVAPDAESWGRLQERLASSHLTKPRVH